VELLFIIVIAAGIGLIARYVVPGRDDYGILLLPSTAAVATAIVWVALVWAGLTFDGGWIWVAGVGTAVVVSVLVALLLPRRRRDADARMLDRLLAARG